MNFSFLNENNNLYINNQNNYLKSNIDNFSNFQHNNNFSNENNNDPKIINFYNEILNHSEKENYIFKKIINEYREYIFDIELCTIINNSEINCDKYIIIFKKNINNDIIENIINKFFNKNIKVLNFFYKYKNSNGIFSLGFNKNIYELYFEDDNKVSISFLQNDNTNINIQNEIINDNIKFDINFYYKVNKIDQILLFLNKFFNKTLIEKITLIIKDIDYSFFEYKKDNNFTIYLKNNNNIKINAKILKDILFEINNLSKKKSSLSNNYSKFFDKINNKNLKYLGFSFIENNISLILFN